MLQFNYDTLSSFCRFIRNIIVEFVLTILFLAIGVALLPLIYHFLTTSDTWLVIIFIVIACELVALFMAWIYNQ